MPEKKVRKPEPETPVEAKLVGERDHNYAGQKNSKLVLEAADWYEEIRTAYDNRNDADQGIQENWRIFNCVLDENQQYSGFSEQYIPAVRDCVNARMRRKQAQMWPDNDRHLTAVSEDATRPDALLALLEHYIRGTQLKSVVQQDQIAGDISGQWNLMLDWEKKKRLVTTIVQKPKELQAPGGLVLASPDETEQDVEENTMWIEGPVVYNVATEDVAIIPPTATAQTAECVAVKVRMTPRAAKKRVRDDFFTDLDVDKLIEDDNNDNKNPARDRTHEAGIQTNGTNKFILFYRCWFELEIEGEDRIFECWFCQGGKVVRLAQLSLWGGRIPLFSEPVEPEAGSGNGRPKVTAVKQLQWWLNDCAMIASDSAQYALMPIVMTDPLKNPAYANMVMSMAAIWPTDPNATKVLEFPPLWKDAFQLMDWLKAQIRQSMDVTDAMAGIGMNSRRNTQQVAQGAQEGAVPIVDEGKRYEQVMLQPIMEMIFEMDQQFREESVTVMTMGEIGIIARMEKIPPQQFSQRYFLRWLGTDYQQSLQKLQSQIAFMNVLNGIDPSKLNRRRIDITPIIDTGAELLFGPETSRRVVIDESKSFTVPPEMENQLMFNQHEADVHPADDDMLHLQSHMQAAMQTGDPQGKFRAHIALHQGQMKAKALMQQQDYLGGRPGVPGGAGPAGGPAPGVAGTPRPGSVPALPRGGQQPPGAIHKDVVADPMGGRG